MRRFAVTLALVCLALPAGAQAPRAPRVHVTVERGPIPARVFQRAWPGRSFRRCEADAPDDVVRVHVRVDPDASVVIDHDFVDDDISAPARCVFDVLTRARFHPQVEATHVYVTIVFRPAMANRAQSPRSSNDRSASPSDVYSSAVL